MSCFLPCAGNSYYDERWQWGGLVEAVKPEGGSNIQWHDGWDGTRLNQTRQIQNTKLKLCCYTGYRLQFQHVFSSIQASRLLISCRAEQPGTAGWCADGPTGLFGKSDQYMDATEASVTLHVSQLAVGHIWIWLLWFDYSVKQVASTNKCTVV